MEIKSTWFYAQLKKIAYLLAIYPKERAEQKRCARGKEERFSNLKKWKDIHKGKRCFVVATGPSLTTVDYLKMKEEYTIGVNGLCLWFQKHGVETDYFVVSDDDVFRRVESTLAKAKSTKVFISDRVAQKETAAKKYQLFPVTVWNRFMTKDSCKKISNDFSVCSYDEETVVLHAIQLAIYMGFKEIYLVGTDCNYSQGKKYAVDHGKPVDAKVGPKMIRAYLPVKVYQDKFGVKVFNATRGGMLEVFDRKDLDKVLEEGK